MSYVRFITRLFPFCVLLALFLSIYIIRQKNGQGLRINVVSVQSRVVSIHHEEQQEQLEEKETTTTSSMLDHEILLQQRKQEQKHNDDSLTTAAATMIGRQSKNDSYDSYRQKETGVDVIVMVMGEAQNFNRWNTLWSNYLTHEPEPAVIGDDNSTTTNHHVLAPKPNVSKLSFIYASYDKPIIAQQNETANSTKNSTASTTTTSYTLRNHSETSWTIYMPGSTWTQARNKLAEEALRHERRRGRKYDYWVFLDDDVEFHCRKREGGVLFAKNDKIEIGQVCWNRFLDFLNLDELIPQKATLLTVKMGNANFLKNYDAVSNADPFVSAFKRDSIPYHLPYATLKEGMSEHNSAYVQYCLMFTCMKQSAVYIPNICGRNNDHRPYTRGFNTSEIAEAAVQNYGPYQLNMQHCDTFEYYGARDSTRAKNASILDLKIPSKNTTCDHIRNRFFAWEAKVMMRS